MNLFLFLSTSEKSERLIIPPATADIRQCHPRGEETPASARRRGFFRTVPPEGF